MNNPRPKTARSTPFSDFIRNASPEEKERVYRIVLEKASERQRRILDAGRQEKPNEN